MDGTKFVLSQTSVTMEIRVDDISQHWDMLNSHMPSSRNVLTAWLL